MIPEASLNNPEYMTDLVKQLDPPQTAELLVGRLKELRSAAKGKKQYCLDNEKFVKACFERHAGTWFHLKGEHAFLRGNQAVEQAVKRYAYNLKFVPQNHSLWKNLEVIKSILIESPYRLAYLPKGHELFQSGAGIRKARCILKEYPYDSAKQY